MNTGEITVVGNLTAEPELRYSAGGNAWGQFSVACNHRYTPRGGQPVEKVKFYRCKVFGQQAENFATTFSKGDRVLVSGRLEDEKWTDQNQQERTSETLVVEEIAASIRFASATLTKNPSQGGQNRPRYGNGAEAGPPPASSPAQAPAPVSQAPDEDPFF